MRTSIACGGATSTSSITSGFPASHATAAAKFEIHCDKSRIILILFYFFEFSVQ